MDKVKVNNQVVKMRKHVKRARLFAINKFTKQLKQLQTKKGKEGQFEKNQRKVERLLEKVKILKKMIPDFVSKKALSKAQDWSAILAQKNVPLEDQCLALLASNKEVQKEVEQFYVEECQLAEKIPSLFLEWEMKSKEPKSPHQKKKASDIKRQKMDKITKRKKSNFKGATFPNNVAIDKKLKPPGNKNKKSSAPDENISEERADENSEPIEDEEDDQLKSESSIDSEDSQSGNFFIKAVQSSKNQIKNSESMEEDLNEIDESDSEFSDDASDGESQDFFTKPSKYQKSPLPKKKIKDQQRSAKIKEKSLGNVDSSSEEKSIDSGDINNSFPSRLESDEKSESYTEPSIAERLIKFSKTDTKNLKTKSSKLKSASQNTKAIKVLDLNELQDTDQITIQSVSIDSQESESSLPVVPKKDYFFLNGDDEVQSSEDEANVNGYKGFKPKRKFSNFHHDERNSKFKRNSFGDRPRKSLNNLKEKDFGRNDSRFPNKGAKVFNKNKNSFQSIKGNNVKEDDSRFQRNFKGSSQFNDRKKFDFKSKEGAHQFRHSDSAKPNNPSNFRRDNKKNTASISFQPKKQTNDKDEKNVQLHPSWQAKNKLKEAAKTGFKGKRIVFD